MGRTRFRILIGLIAFSYLAAASEFGALLGFAAIWAMIIAMAPVAIGASVIPGAQGLDLPAWTPQAVAGAIGLAIMAATLRQFLKANAARLAGRHDEARRCAFSGLLIASVPAWLVLSVMALAEAWP